LIHAMGNAAGSHDETRRPRTYPFLHEAHTHDHAIRLRIGNTISTYHKHIQPPIVIKISDHWCMVHLKDHPVMASNHRSDHLPRYSPLMLVESHLRTKDPSESVSIDIGKRSSSNILPRRHTPEQ
jgi:hypothetical protein